METPISQLPQDMQKELLGLKALITYSETIKVPKQAFWFTMTGLYSIYVVSTTAVLFWKGWNSPHFIWKSRIFTFIATLANLVFVIHAMITEALTPKYPCSVRLWITYYTVFFWSLAVHVRGLKYMHIVRVNTIKSDLADVLNELEKHSDFEGSNAKSIDNENTKRQSLMSLEKGALSKHYSDGAFLASRKPKNVFEKISRWFSCHVLRKNNTDISSLSLEEQYTILRQRLTSTLRKERWLSDRFFLAVFAVIAIILAVACVLGQRDPTFKHQPPYYVCKPGISPPMYFLYIWLFCNIFIIFPILIYFCRGIRDAYGMRSELQVSLIAGSIAIPTMLLYNEFAPKMALVKVTGYVFTCTFLGVAHWMLIVRPMLSILNENKHKNRSRSNLPRSSTSSRPSNMTRREQFEFLLDSPEGFEKLAEAARRTFCPENVDFLRDYQYLKWRICYTVLSDGDVHSSGDTSPSGSRHLTNEVTSIVPSNSKSNAGYGGVYDGQKSNSDNTIYQFSPTGAPLHGSEESMSLNLMGTTSGIDFGDPSQSTKKDNKSKTGKSRHFSRSIFPGFSSNLGFAGLGLGTTSPESSKDANANNSNGPTTPLPFLSKNQVMNGESSLLADTSILPLPNTILKTLIKKRLLPSLNRMNGVADPVNGDANSEVLVPRILHRRFRQFFKKYIPESAALCVNVSQQVSKPIITQFEEGRFTVDMFDRALSEVLDMLYQNTFSKIQKD